MTKKEYFKRSRAPYEGDSYDKMVRELNGGFEPSSKEEYDSLKMKIVTQQMKDIADKWMKSVFRPGFLGSDFAPVAVKKK